ncbi:MAG: polygalacturonase [Psychroserpens sp.]|jgi:polygalacturonase
MVNIPAGKYIIDGPLRLENDVYFHIEEEAGLLFRTRYESYMSQVITRYEGTDLYNYYSLMYVYQKRNVDTTG